MSLFVSCWNTHILTCNKSILLFYNIINSFLQDLPTAKWPGKSMKAYLLFIIPPAKNILPKPYLTLGSFRSENFIIFNVVLLVIV